MLETIFPFVFGGVVLFFLYRVIRHGGLRGAMFGASVLETLGEVEGKGQGPASSKLKVHLLGESSDPNRPVGLEIVTTTFASYQMHPITLPRGEAQKLLTLLQRATSAQ